MVTHIISFIFNVFALLLYPFYWGLSDLNLELYWIIEERFLFL